MLPKASEHKDEKVNFNYFDQDEDGEKVPTDSQKEDKLSDQLDDVQKTLEDELERIGGKGFTGDAEGSFNEKLQFLDTLSEGLKPGSTRQQIEIEEDGDEADFNETNILGGLSNEERQLFNKMLAAFEKRTKVGQSNQELDDEEGDILESLTEKERQIYNDMLQSMAEITKSELLDEEEIQALNQGKFASLRDNANDKSIEAPNVAQIAPDAASVPLVSTSQVADVSRKRPAAKSKAIETQPAITGTTVIIPRNNLPREGQAYITRLNETLEKAVGQPKKLRKELWRWYSISRKTLASDYSRVPVATWMLLWDEFAVDSLDNPDRMAHIITLANDLHAANVPLKPEQTLLHIEAQFVDGHQEKALNSWESSRSSLTLDDATAAAYWALGVRMLSELKQPARAQDAADILLNNLGAVSEARALLPLIRAWSVYPDKTANQLAWAMYVRFKVWKGDKMEMQDYDDVAGIFSEAQQPDLALAVFRDMMLTGDELAKQYDSITLYQRLTGIKNVNALKSFQLSPEETSWRSSEHLSLLPAKFRNKFFFGSWIKKLVGEEQIDWAAQVVELMSQKGIKPSATYLNGIIGAWFRSGAQKNLDKGTEMAWKMIAARLEFVRQRSMNESANFTGVARAVLSDNREGFKRPSSHYAAAQATLETFTVLIEHYQKLNQKGRVQELLTTLKAAKIRPTTPFVNSLLELGTAINNRPWVWSIYEHFMMHDSVPATQYTFVILWRNMKDHVDPVINRNKAGFPSPRFLFAEMGRSSLWKKEMMARELYSQIILCFGLSDDQVGTAVALRAMQHNHGVYPDESTVRSVVLQLAKLSVTNVKGFRARRLNINKDTQRRITEIGNVMKKLKEQRTAALEAQGIDVEAMTAEEKSEESLMLLISLLKYATEGRLKSDPNLRAKAGVGGIDYLGREAAKDMGVEQSLPWLA